MFSCLKKKLRLWVFGIGCLTLRDRSKYLSNKQSEPSDLLLKKGFSKDDGISFPRLGCKDWLACPLLLSEGNLPRWVSCLQRGPHGKELGEASGQRLVRNGCPQINNLPGMECYQQPEHGLGRKAPTTPDHILVETDAELSPTWIPDQPKL
jgi:hypothetical protein